MNPIPRRFSGPNLFSILAVVTIACAAVPTGAKPALLFSPALLVESNMYCQPGLELSLSSASLWGGRPAAALRYTTTRIATALGSNALVKDHVAVSGSWNFRPRAMHRPLIRFTAGLSHFSVENDALFSSFDNTRFYYLISGGYSLWHPSGRAGLFLEAGFCPATSQTIYPFFWSAGIRTAIVGRRP